MTLWPLAAAEIEGGEGNFVDSLLRAEPPEPGRRSARPAGLCRADRMGRVSRSPRSWTPRSSQLLFELPVVDHRARHRRCRPDLRAPESLERLLAVIAARSGSLVSFQGMGRDLGLDKNTVSAHIRVLENLFLVRALKPWNVNLGARQIKSPKLYVVDSGLLTFLLKANARRIETDAAIAEPRCSRASQRWSCSATRQSLGVRAFPLPLPGQGRA